MGLMDFVKSRQPRAKTREAELLAQLEKYKPTYEDMMNFLIRVHISDGRADDGIGHLLPQTLRKIELFLKMNPAPPKPVSDEDRYITLI